MRRLTEQHCVGVQDVHQSVPIGASKKLQQLLHDPAALPSKRQSHNMLADPLKHLFLLITARTQQRNELIAEVHVCCEVSWVPSSPGAWPCNVLLRCQLLVDNILGVCRARLGLERPLPRLQSSHP